MKIGFLRRIFHERFGHLQAPDSVSDANRAPDRFAAAVEALENHFPSFFPVLGCFFDETAEGFPAVTAVRQRDRLRNDFVFDTFSDFPSGGGRIRKREGFPVTARGEIRQCFLQGHGRWRRRSQEGIGVRGKGKGQEKTKEIARKIKAITAPCLNFSVRFARKVIHKSIFHVSGIKDSTQK